MSPPKSPNEVYHHFPEKKDLHNWIIWIQKWGCTPFLDIAVYIVFTAAPFLMVSHGSRSNCAGERAMCIKQKNKTGWFLLAFSWAGHAEQT